MIEAILIPILVAVIGIVAKFVSDWLRVKLTPEQLNTALDLTRTAVLGAEKFAEATGIKGKDKYEYAEAAIVEGAKKIGLKLPPEVVNSFIHSVLAELQGVGEPTTAEESVPVSQVQDILAQQQSVHEGEVQALQQALRDELAKQVSNVTPIDAKS